MRVRFLARAQIAGQTFQAGAVGDIETDAAIDLLARRLVEIDGEGERHGRVWNDLATSASGINPAGAVNAPSVDTEEADFPGTLLFSGAADNLLAGQIQITHNWAEGTAMTPHIHWMLTADSSAAVTWEFYYRIAPIGEPAGAWIGPLAGSVAVSHANVANAQSILSFGDIDMSSYQISDIISWRLYRRGSTDANNSAARLLSIDFHYLMDAPGSTHPFIKQ